MHTLASQEGMLLIDHTTRPSRLAGKAARILALWAVSVHFVHAGSPALEPDFPTIQIRTEMARQFRILDQPLKPRKLQRHLHIPGVIRPDETKLVRITTVAPGRIREIMVYPGDTVERLDQLASIDSVELAQRKSAYLQAKARAELARRMLDIEQEWAKLEVDARKPFEDAKREVLRAKNTFQVARTQLEVAERRFRAEESLYEDGISSRQSLDQARATYAKIHSDLDRSREVLAVAEQRLDREREAYQRKILPKRELQQAQARLDVAEIELEGAQTNMSIYGLKPSTSTLDLSQEYVKKNPVVTPRSGMVIRQNVRVGDVVQPNQHLFEVADLSTIWFVGNLYEKDRREVHVGDKLTLEVASHKGIPFEGKVMRVFPIVEATTRTVPCIGYLYNPKRMLLPGMFAKARIEVEAPRPRLLVDRKAIQDFRGEEVAFIRIEDDSPDMDSYQMRRVEIGLEFDLEETEEREELVEILSGLKEGMRVVDEGAFSLVSEFLKRGGGAE